MIGSSTIIHVNSFVKHSFVENIKKAFTVSARCLNNEYNGIVKYEDLWIQTNIVKIADLEVPYL